MNYNTQMTNNQNHSRHPELDSRHSVLDTESKTPKLRFKEFSGEWEEKRFGDIYSFYSTNSFSRDNLNYDEGNIRNIHYGDIHTKFSTLFKLENERVPFINPDVNLAKIKEENYCLVGDLVIADASEDYNDIGKSIEIISLNNEKTLAGLHTFLARPNKHNMALGFVGSLLKSWNVRKQIMTIAQGTKVLSLSSGRLSEVTLNVPSISEQQRIASFLTAIDTKIDQLIHKKELLEKYKKGVMQKVFSQELRFKADNGSEFPEWEEKTLGAYIDLLSGFAFKGDDISENTNGIPLLRGINITEGAIRHTVEMDRYFCGKVEKLKKYFLQTNDLVISMDGSKVGKNSALISKQDKDSLLIQRVARIRANIKGDIHFIYQIVRSNYFIKYVDMVNTSSGIPHISAEQIKNFPFCFPTKEEQTKIANFLSTIDTEITLRQTQGERLKEFKKALLQQMFV